MDNLLWKYRRELITATHLFLIILSVFSAFFLHYEGNIPPEQTALLSWTILILIPLRSAAFYVFGLQKGLWKYVSMGDLAKIFKAVAASSAIFCGILYFILGVKEYALSVIILDSILLIMLSGGLRFIARMLKDKSTPATGKRVMIYGAGEAAIILMKELRANGYLNYQVIGFMDDDVRKNGMTIDGFPILGSRADMRDVVKKHNIEEVIIAVPSASPAQMRKIVHECNNARVSFKTIPSIEDIIVGKVQVSQIRDVKLEDLLFREEICIEHDMAELDLAGKTVLVTGAAGSIGSELVRQLGKYHIKTLIMLDQAESNLFFRDLEIKEKYPTLDLVTILGDILNIKKMEKILAEYKPQVIFHAAAYKHVPVMESNASEAIKVNVKGTKNLAQLAHIHNVEKFIFISTDKAVNPSSVMGASKRVAELFLKDFSRTSSTRFVIVRFGNVLGSDGSIIPIIKKQIGHNGPVTITHREIKRYFMTIPEAVSLVIQAGCMGKGGEVFVLDMGLQVKIIDLAENMIRMMGLVPHTDIKIIYTGLRPGEKLYEELYYEYETVEKTAHGKIMKAVSAANQECFNVTQKITQLEKFADEESSAEILNGLKEIVPTYQDPHQLISEGEQEFLDVREI